MVDIICEIWNNKLSNLYNNLVLLNRLLHAFVILIPSTAVGCFSKQFFVTPQVNQREEKEANITSKLFIPHQGNCWKYRAPILSSDASCTSLQQIFYDLSTLLGIHVCPPTFILIVWLLHFLSCGGGLVYIKILLFLSMYYIQAKCGPKLLYCLETNQLTE